MSGSDYTAEEKYLKSISSRNEEVIKTLLSRMCYFGILSHRISKDLELELKNIKKDNNLELVFFREIVNQQQKMQDAFLKVLKESTRYCKFFTKPR